MNQEFSIEEQYKLYLKIMKLDESKMPEVQRVETRRTFYGAWGQLLMILQNDLTKLSDEKAFKILDGMVTEVGQFFLNETKNQN